MSYEHLRALATLANYKLQPKEPYVFQRSGGWLATFNAIRIETLRRVTAPDVWTPYIAREVLSSGPWPIKYVPSAEGIANGKNFVDVAFYYPGEIGVPP